MSIMRSLVTTLSLLALALGACGAPDGPAPEGPAPDDAVAEIDGVSAAQSEVDPNPLCLDQTYTDEWREPCPFGLHKDCSKVCITHYSWVWVPAEGGLPPRLVCKKGVTICGAGSCGQCHEGGHEAD